jgi:microcystin synthetase protein McyE
MVEDIIVLSYGVEESLDIIATHADDLAAVLVEPVQSRKPDLQPQEFLQKLRQITHKKGSHSFLMKLLPAFALLGGAQEWFNVEADIVIYGKAIGGGLPISMICG